MVIQRAFRYRLYPTPEQASAMEQTAGAVRFIYNLGLEQRRDFWRQARRVGASLSYVQQARELTQLRAQCSWLAAVHVTPLQRSLKALDRAYAGFFSRAKRFPQFKSRRAHAAFTHAGREVQLRQVSGKWTLVRIPKIGLVKMRLTREQRGRVVSVTFSRGALGWHAAFACEIDHEVPANDLPPLGIDRGIANTLALSTGEMLSTPNLAQLDRRKKRAQRILARRVRGSNRYRKQRRALGRITGKIARCRADWRHKVTTGIANRFGHIAVEALSITNMTAAGRGKRGLNRSILEQGWRGFETVLTYKLQERGGTLEKINPAYTSQTCSACGTIDRASRESQASFACRHCGFATHADTNAAINILRRSTAVAEGSAYAPVEARTSQVALAA